MSKIIDTCALSSRVLVVAVADARGEWAAYCDAVAGEDHEAEAKAVREHGNKIPKNVAKALFPAAAMTYTWRK